MRMFDEKYIVGMPADGFSRRKKNALKKVVRIRSSTENKFYWNWEGDHNVNEIESESISYIETLCEEQNWELLGEL